MQTLGKNKPILQNVSNPTCICMWPCVCTCTCTQKPVNMYMHVVTEFLLRGIVGCCLYVSIDSTIVLLTGSCSEGFDFGSMRERATGTCNYFMGLNSLAGN